MKYYLILIPIIIISFFGCKDNPLEPTQRDIRLPSLSDNIPYTNLGSGKIVFQRIGPMDNNYEAACILDINNRKTWGLDFGAFDGPRISPEGDRIAITKFTDFNTKWDVWSSDIYGNNINRISNVDGQERCPVWLPDNNRIIYWSDAFSANQITPVFISDILSSTTNKILDFGHIDFPQVYSPEDIITVSKNDVCLVSIYKGLCTFGINGSNFQVIRARPEGWRYYCPSWNPAGDRIAVMCIKVDSTSSSGNEDTFYQEMSIVLLNIDGSNPATIFTTSETQTGLWSGHNDYSLCWSPDGSKILFNTREGFLTSHICVINSDGSNFTPVTSLPGATDRSLSWGK